MIAIFEKHANVLTEFIQKEYLNHGAFTVDFFRQLHRLFYPLGYSIKAVGNDGVEMENLPWEWRKQIRSHYITDFSKNEDIPHDLENSLEF